MCFLPLDNAAQEGKALLYGKVSSRSGAVFTGQIRFGAGGLFWDDLFTAVKTGDETPCPDRIASWWNFGGGLLSIWEDRYSSSPNQFLCRFGDIRRIRSGRDAGLALSLKNNRELLLLDTRRNYGSTVAVMDAAMGLIELPWPQIREIVFAEAPSGYDLRHRPLYGTVTTPHVQFRGRIQWDGDERFEEDVLEGSDGIRYFRIPFGQIRRIENLGDASRVTLQNGSSLLLGGTNDVDSRNRGIIIQVEGLGRVAVPWAAFVEVRFEPIRPDLPGNYASFGFPERLSGTVKTLDGMALHGTLVYDCDESWDVEILEGVHNGLQYSVPFRNIRRISPKNTTHAAVELLDGSLFLLGHLQDVSMQNRGILIRERSGGEPIHIPWSLLDEVVFD
jgi:hypothetical protein